MTPKQAEARYKAIWPELNAKKAAAIAKGDTKTAKQWRRALSALSVECHARHKLRQVDVAPVSEWLLSPVLTLDEDSPLWLVNEQIKGLLEGDGASEDHEDVLAFLRRTGLPEDTVKRMHQAIVHGDAKSKNYFPHTLTAAETDVLEERRRQIACEGFTPAHDAKHSVVELVQAAGCYALYADAYPTPGEPPPLWPWESSWWKPKSARRDLVRAAALLLAALEHPDMQELGDAE